MNVFINVSLPVDTMPNEKVMESIELYTIFKVQDA